MILGKRHWGVGFDPHLTGRAIIVVGPDDLEAKVRLFEIGADDHTWILLTITNFSRESKA
jgi:hypothetical protein